MLRSHVGACQETSDVRHPLLGSGRVANGVTWVEQMSSLRMTTTEREAFLAEPHLCALAVEQADRPPLVVPVWYLYDNALVSIHTARGQLKTELLRRAGRFSVCIQTYQVPYRYVSAEGAIVAIEPIPASEREAMVARYLSLEQGTMYLRRTEAVASDDVAVRMRPERWRTVDFSRDVDGF